MRKVSCLVGLAAALATTTPALATDLAEFGRCLASKGAVFYGASWCPHCEAQKQTLGEGMSSVRYIECAPGGNRTSTASACTSAGVSSYPTWVFADGSRASGSQSLARLAAKTGCENPAAGGGQRLGGKPAVKKSATGPKIIEVPRE
jgi:glutaredoxin